MECFFCKGPAHPATGCQYTANVVACAACTKECWKWFKQHQYRGTRFNDGPTFYECINNEPRKLEVSDKMVAFFKEMMTRPGRHDLYELGDKLKKKVE